MSQWLGVGFSANKSGRMALDRNKVSSSITTRGKVEDMDIDVGKGTDTAGVKWQA